MNTKRRKGTKRFNVKRLEPMLEKKKLECQLSLRKSTQKDRLQDYTKNQTKKIRHYKKNPTNASTAFDHI